MPFCAKEPNLAWQTSGKKTLLHKIKDNIIKLKYKCTTKKAANIHLTSVN